MKKAIAAGLMVLGWAAAAWAANPAPLTTIPAIRALGKADASRAVPVAFEGTVTYFHPDFRYLFVQDGDQAIFVYTPVGAQLLAGDRILIKGVTHAEFSPDVISDSITLLHHGTLPKALAAGFDELMSGKLDCILVTVRGRVSAANLVLRPDVRISPSFTPRVSYLELITDGGYVDVIVNSLDENALKDLLDDDVEVTGAAGGSYDGKWHQTGVLLRTFTFSSVKVLKRAGASPWTLPITPMDKVLAGHHVRDLTPRVRVQGTITYYQPGYYRPGSAIVLQSGAESLWIESLTDAPLRIGDLADATGIPDVASGSPTLTHAEVWDSRTPVPVDPLNVTWQQLADADVAGMHHYDLVSVEGQVVTENRKSSQDEYILAHDGQLFSAIFHHPDPTSQISVPLMRENPLGTTVRVTGICILQDTTLFSGKASFNVLLRNFEDITVIAPAPWLNIRNLMILITFLVLAVFAAGARSWTLERKIRRQTAALAARIEAEAALERRRSRILEDINGSLPLAEVLEEVTEMASFMLDGAPCWCEVTDGARLGNRPADLESRRVVREPILARSGPPLGALFAVLDPPSLPVARESDAFSLGTRLAALAIESRKLYSDLLHRSEFDLLTDIHNRFSLDKQLEVQIADARLKAGIFGLIYIDLDKFKEVNDRYGHQNGDLYLQEIARRMKRQLRSADMLARLGGDEFAVLVPVVRNRAEVEEIAQRLEHSFDESFSTNGFVMHGSASVGIALYPENGASKDSLLNAADAAMYKAKNAKPVVV